MKYFQSFRVTGVANAIAYDNGLKSTESEKKKLVAVHVNMDAWALTDDNEIQGWHERAKICEFPHHMFNCVPKGTAITLQRLELKTRIPVDLDIPVGEAFKIALSCAATAVDMRGVYEYEIIA